MQVVSTGQALDRGTCIWLHQQHYFPSAKTDINTNGFKWEAAIKAGT